MAIQTNTAQLIRNIIENMMTTDLKMIIAGYGLSGIVAFKKLFCRLCQQLCQFVYLCSW